MNQLKIQKSQLNGSIKIPPSKSQTLRAILFASFASLADGMNDVNRVSEIHNYLDSPDTQAMIRACESLGAQITINDVGSLRIKGTQNVKLLESLESTKIIDAGNSGIVLRFIAGIAALGTKPIIITGDHSIQTQRTMEPMLSALRQLGVHAVSKRGDGFAPIEICGPLNSANLNRATIKGQDSQPVSALLIAMALSGSGPFELEVEDPGELPWVALTLDWLDRLGYHCENVNGEFRRYKVGGGRGALKNKEATHQIRPFSSVNYTVPGDLSSVSFPLVAAILTGSELMITNIDLADKQGDKKLIDVLIEMGASLEVARHSIHVNPIKLRSNKPQKLKPVKVDINDFIDALPILTVACCFAEGESVIYNGAVARTKECNRISCTAQELRKMGAKIVEREDGLQIFGAPLFGTTVVSHGDHRLAMSLAVAGMAIDGVTIVEGVNCMAKTYPTFIHDFLKLGANIILKCEGPNIE